MVVELTQAEPQGRLGRYTLLNTLGQGGMAQVFLARGEIEGTEQLVAIKRVLPHYAGQPRFVDMFLNEARIAARLTHENVVKVLDFGGIGGDYYMALEFVHGTDLRQLLGHASARGSLPLGCALFVIDSAAAGLHCAHELRGVDDQLLGVVHRDVSPSNILVGFDGAVKVSDFGVAKAYNESATESGSLKGKIPYMSPEQCSGGKLDRRSDIFSLGALLYETTVGRRAFQGINEFQIMNAIALGQLTPPHAIRPDYSPELEAIVLRALHTDPDDRYPTMEALRTDLNAFANKHGVALHSVDMQRFLVDKLGRRPYPMVRTDPGHVDPSAPQPTEPTIRRRPRTLGRVAWLAAGTGLGCVIALSVAAMASDDDPTDAPGEPTAQDPSDGSAQGAQPQGAEQAPAAGKTNTPDPGPRRPPVPVVGSAPAAAPESGAPAPPKPRPRRKRPRKRKSMVTKEDLASFNPPE